MKSILVLKEEREKMMLRMQAILDEAKKGASEGEVARAFTDLEKSDLGNLEKQIDAIDTEIREAERFAELEAKSFVKQGKIPQSMRDTPENLQKRFSLIRAARISANQMNGLEGAEAEVHQEEVKKQRLFGRTYQGFAIPQEYLLGKRTTMITGTANIGGDLIKDIYHPYVDALLPQLMLERLGATIIPVDGNYVSVKGTQIAGGWAAEVVAVGEKNPTLTKTEILPEKYGAFIPISKELLRVDGYGIEMRLRQQLGNAIKIAVDAAGINGSGTGEPDSILSNASIYTEAIGVAGGNVTWQHILNLQKGVETALADVSTMAFLTTPGLKAKLKGTAKESGYPVYIWGENELDGIKAYATTQVPSTLTKGGTVGSCHALILGDFSKLSILQWGGIDLLANPYTYDLEGILKLTALSWWNTAIDYPEYFGAIVDATITTGS